MQLHHSRHFRRWVPEALLGLWGELHPNAPLQLQLPFVMEKAKRFDVEMECGTHRQGRNLNEKIELLHPSLALGE
jgi:hypothetical protein